MTLEFPSFPPILTKYLNGDEINDPVTSDIANKTKEFINNLVKTFNYPETIINSIFNHNYQGADISLADYPILRVYRKGEVCDLSYQLPIKTTTIVFSYVIMFSRNAVVANLFPFVADCILLLCQNTLLKEPDIPVFNNVTIDITRLESALLLIILQK